MDGEISHSNYGHPDIAIDEIRASHIDYDNPGEPSPKIESAAEFGLVIALFGVKMPWL